MLELAKHIVNQRSAEFDPGKFEDHYETALVDLINRKRAGQPVAHKPRPRGANVHDLMDALRRSVGEAEKPVKKTTKKSSKQRRSA